MCDVALGPLSARIFTFSQRHICHQKKQLSPEKPGDIFEQWGGEFWVKALPCACGQPGKCWYWACTGAAQPMSVRLGYPTPSWTCLTAACHPQEQLEGKLASEFTLSLGRSLVAALMWLFIVWNRKLVLRVAEVLEDGFECNTMFLFVVLVPASPA